MVDEFLDAMGGISEKYVEQCGIALGYLPGKRHKFKLQSLLIAAAVAALLAATAGAAGLYGRQQHLAEMPADPAGEVREAFIPNGFRGTPTYVGSAQWWAYMAEWEDTHGNQVPDYDLEFTKGDFEQYQICRQYNIYEEEQVKRLYEIAEEYNLNLYRESLLFSDRKGEGEGRKLFFELSGAKPFLDGEQHQKMYGDVYFDGSFWLEGILKFEDQDIIYNVSRIRSGSIYPYGGANLHTAYEEVEYINARNQQLVLDLFDTTASIHFVNPSGDTYISVFLYFPQEIAYLNQIGTVRKIADRINFEALLESNDRPKEILDVNTGAENNLLAVEKVEAFQNSAVFRAGKEFHAFFTEHFYGSSYAEPYGFPGYEDIDAEMDRLAQKYDLRIPKEKTKGNDFSEECDVYDNGCFCYRSPQGAYGVELTIHYMPKDALYTRMYLFTESGKYRRVWEYETQGGVPLILFTEGTEEISGSFALYENQDTYILLDFAGADAQSMISQIESVDWDKLIK